MSKLRRTILPFILFLSLSACVNPISREAREHLDNEVTFAMVAENPSAYIDKHLMLGGVIISVDDDKQGSVMELMEWRLNSWGEPLSLDDAGRRYLVKSSRTIDPERYAKGRLVTLAGVTLGSEMRLLGEHPYQYPVFAVEEMHLWETPFRYGIHPHPDPQNPVYVGPESPGRSHPYDPGFYAYPYTPYWYRVE